MSHWPDLKKRFNLHLKGTPFEGEDAVYWRCFKNQGTVFNKTPHTYFERKVHWYNIGHLITVYQCLNCQMQFAPDDSIIANYEKASWDQSEFVLTYFPHYIS
jgi:hypothetical protein